MHDQTTINTTLTEVTDEEQNKKQQKNFQELVFPFDNLQELNRHQEVDPSEEQWKRQNVKRETAMVQVGDLYSRWHSFAHAQEWKQEVLRGRVVERMECGAVQAVPPAEKKKDPVLKNAKVPIRFREVTIDIDMDDQDQQRTCCSGKKVCKACWKFVTVAAEMITQVLNECFGFEQILQCFSGRRGCHMWIQDHEARDCTDANRRSIQDFLNFKDKSIFEDPLHPTIHYIYHTHTYHSNDGFVSLFCKFKEILIEQRLISSNPDVILDLIHFNDLKTFIKNKIATKVNASLETSGFATILEQNNASNDQELEVELFELIFGEIKSQENNKQKNMGKLQRKQPLVEEMVLSVLSPKLDENVTIRSDHLLKQPFSVHPGSKKISVCMSLPMLQSFDPDHAPNFVDLSNYLDTKTSRGMRKLDCNNAHTDQIINDNLLAFRQGYDQPDHSILPFLEQLIDFIKSYKIYYEKYRINQIKQKNINNQISDNVNLEF